MQVRHTKHRSRRAVAGRAARRHRAGRLRGRAYGLGAGRTGDRHAWRRAPSGAIQPTGTPHLIPDFADLVSQVRPAVVSITTTLRATGDEDGDEAGGPAFPGPAFPGMGRPGEPHGGPHRAMEARGSGFIIDAEGTVVTNNHVVQQRAPPSR